MMENNLKILKPNKIKDDLKKNKNLFLIPLKWGGKPFLGLAQLSKIVLLYFPE
jgi:hypothetical protein